MTELIMVGGGPAAQSNKRVMIMLGVAAVVAVLALVLPKVLAGEDEVVDDFASFAVAAPAELGTEPTDEVVAEPARTFEVFSTKNPFTPLIDTTPVEAIAPAPAGTVAAGVGVAVAPDGTTSPAVGTTTSSSGSSTPEAVARTSSAGDPASTSTEPVSSQRVALLEVFVDEAAITVASVRVNDTVHEVAEGAAFATRYQVVTLSVADGCGQFLYGDDSFRLCEGEELLK